MALFYGWGSTGSRLEPLCGGSLLFTTKFMETRPRKDERLSRPWSHPIVMNTAPQDFPSRTTWSHLFLRKEEIRPNTWPKIPSDLILWRSACQILSKAMDMSNATAPVAPDLLKDLAIQLDTTNCKKVCSWSRRPKTISEIKKGHIFLGDQRSLTSFSRTSLTTERRLTGW